MTPSFRTFLLPVAASLLFACGGAENDVDDGSGGQAGGGASLPTCPPDTGAEPAHTDVTGSYSVPVPAELEPYASYLVDSITACQRAGVVELGYKLPALLVGKPQRVSFSGSYDPNADVLMLSGDGSATCDVSSAGWSCLEHFVGVAVDLEAVAKEAEGLPAAEVQGRLDVAAYFGGDPIGILDFLPMP